MRATPLRRDLSDQEIERIGDYHFASMLAEDDEIRRDGTGSEPVFQAIAKQLSDAGVAATTPFQIGDVPAFGLSGREMFKARETLDGMLPFFKDVLARGDLSQILEDLDELLSSFQLNLDRASPAFRKLGMTVLRKHVSALQAIERRNSGEPVATPRVKRADRP